MEVYMVGIVINNGEKQTELLGLQGIEKGISHCGWSLLQAERGIVSTITPCTNIQYKWAYIPAFAVQ
jgi:hypothetical protein